MQYVPSYPSMGHKDQYQPYSAAQAPTMSKASQRGQSMGQGRGQGSQAGTLGTPGRIYTVVPLTDQWISQLYKVCFCYLAYKQGYCFILVHRIHLLLHHVGED